MIHFVTCIEIACWFDCKVFLKKNDMSNQVCPYILSAICKLWIVFYFVWVCARERIFIIWYK